MLWYAHSRPITDSVFERELKSVVALYDDNVFYFTHFSHAIHIIQLNYVINTQFRIGCQKYLNSF